MKMTYRDRDKYDTRHGGPFDRGAADSYYGRPSMPHCYEGGSYQSRLIEQSEMTMEQVADYYAGYDWNEQCGDKKDYS